MYAQVDDEGYITRMYETIIDWSKDQEAVTTDNCHTTTKSGNRRYRNTTVGWKLLVLWKDGSEQWIPLKDMKESHPIEKCKGGWYRPRACICVVGPLHSSEA